MSLVPLDAASELQDADRPQEFSARDWRQIAVAAVRSGLDNRVPTTAAAASFYGLLSFIPAVAAFGAAYGAFAGPNALDRQLETFADLVPAGVLELVRGEAVRFAHGARETLGLKALIFGGAAVFSASSAVRVLMRGLNTAFQTRETRSFLHRRILSFAFALGIAAGLAAEVALVIRSGDFLAREPDVFWPMMRLIGRWASLFAILAVALTLLYRYGPDRERARWRWVTPGSVLAAAVGLVTAAAMSVYLAHFANYERTYGGLGSILALVLWIWASMIVALGGAELNGAMECRTSAVTGISGRPCDPATAEPES